MSGLRVFVFYCLEATYTNLRSLDIRANWFSTFTCFETTFSNFCRQMSSLRVFVFYCLEATYTNLRSLDIRANWFSAFTCSETTSIHRIKKEVPLHPFTHNKLFYNNSVVDVFLFLWIWISSFVTEYHLRV